MRVVTDGLLVLFVGVAVVGTPSLHDPVQRTLRSRRGLPSLSSSVATVVGVVSALALTVPSRTVSLSGGQLCCACGLLRVAVPSIVPLRKTFA